MNLTRKHNGYFLYTLIGEDKKCTNFFYFFLNLIVIHIFFYVDLVRWQRTKATLKKKNFSVHLKLLNKKDFETTL